MKVLLFHPAPIPVSQYGGIERVVVWLARGLASLGIDVEVACLLAKGATLENAVKHIAGGREDLRPRISIFPVNPLDRSEEQLKKFNKSRWDIVHLMAPPRDIALEDLPFPSLVTIHGN